jgi:cytochrome c556
MKRLLLIVALLAVGVVHGVRAEGTVSAPADDFIAARQAGMDLQFALVGNVKRILESKSDTKLSKDAGDAIAAWGRAIPGLFAPGTDRGHNTRALPVIWSDRSGFEKAASNLTEAAQALSKAASAGNEADVATAFQSTGQACSACHRTYRAR